MKKSSIIWGILFILLGVAILLRSFGVIFFSWSSLWRMWPFVFVFIGIGILPVKSGWKAALNIIALVCMFGLMLWLSKGHPRDGWSRFWDELSWHIDKEIREESRETLQDSDQTIYYTFADTTQRITLDAQFIPGVYKITGKSKANTVKFFLQEQEYSSSFRTEDNLGFIKLHPKIKQKSEFSGGTINLDEKKSYNLLLSSDEANVNLDLARIKTDTLRIAAGASSLWNVTFSDKNAESWVFLNTNTEGEEISLSIPEMVGYQIAEEREFAEGEEEAGQIKKSDNFETASSKIFIMTNDLSKVAVKQQ